MINFIDLNYFYIYEFECEFEFTIYNCLLKIEKKMIIL